MARVKGGLARATLEALVEQGLTIREIARAVDRSTATVRHWLNRYGLKTCRAGTRGDVSAVSPDGMTLRRRCRRHGETDYVVGRDGYFRCRRCRVDSVLRRRRRVKELLAAEAGGRCAICGYDRYLGALQFHHMDPAQKRLGLSRAEVTLSLEVLRAEARKCVLLCSNCHAEVEGRVVALPVE